jgi:hypothetical protein
VSGKKKHSDDEQEARNKTYSEKESDEISAPLERKWVLIGEQTLTLSLMIHSVCVYFTAS